MYEHDIFSIVRNKCPVRSFLAAMQARILFRIGRVSVCSQYHCMVLKSSIRVTVLMCIGRLNMLAQSVRLEVRHCTSSGLRKSFRYLWAFKFTSIVISSVLALVDNYVIAHNAARLTPSVMLHNCGIQLQFPMSSIHSYTHCHPN